jgi:hypothetical protein
MQIICLLVYNFCSELYAYLKQDSADPLVQLPWVPNPSEGGTMLQAEINFCLEDLDSASPLSPLSYSWNGMNEFSAIVTAVN